MIRPANSDDFSFIYELYMHPISNPFLLYEPMEKAEFQPIFNDLITQKIKFIYECDGVAVGMFKLYPLTFRCSHILYLGGLAIHHDYAGKKIGQKMLADIQQYAKEKSYLRIELSVSEGNTKAIHLYEKAGFEREGVLRKYAWLKSKNTFWNEYLMSWLA